MLEIGILGAVTVVIAILIRRRLSKVVFSGSVVCGLALISVSAWMMRPGQSKDDIVYVPVDELRPAQVAADGYISSESCKECHPNQHATWHASYHRTMTQIASPEAIFGDFNNVHVEARGKQFDLSRTEDEFFFEMSDLPSSETPNPNVVKNSIVMTTGSHHLQVYWYPSGLGRSLKILPIVYLREDKRWIPEAASFLQPPDEQTREDAGVWNHSCVHCHTTHGRPRLQMSIANLGDSMDTHVGEFGIACEACHGPAEAHVRRQRAAKLGALTETDTPDPIVNPARIKADLSAQVCGRCHSIMQPKSGLDLDWFNQAGFAFRPGQPLDETLDLIRPDEEVINSQMNAGSMTREQVMEAFDHHFWRDGSVRVIGREFNGLFHSACYQKGEMSCLSCHVMHKSDDDKRSIDEWRNDQLKTEALSDAACLNCHKAEDYQAVAHTHHPLETSGSQCVNCHMPHTTYGLFKTINSHTIDSPNVAVDLQSGRPNACNLCHLDQTLSWTADKLNEWYGIDKPEIPKDQQSTSAAALWAIRGDAGQRVIMAWHMGWQESMQVSGTDWMAPFLGNLLDDPYAAVRYVASRSLKRHSGYEALKYDFVGEASERQAAAEKVLQEFRLPGAESSDAERLNRLLLKEDGSLDLTSFEKLKAMRNERRVKLDE